MKFYVFEGLKGCGKTTAMLKVKERLTKVDPERASKYLFAFREPGTTDVGETLRSLMIEQPDMAAQTRLHLFMAARCEMIAKRLKPLWELETSAATENIILMDRWTDSTLAYQGFEHEPIARKVVGEGWPWSRPMTFYINTSPQICEQRKGLRFGRDHQLIIENRSVHLNYQTILERSILTHIPIDGSLPADEIADQITRRILEETRWDQK